MIPILLNANADINLVPPNFQPFILDIVIKKVLTKFLLPEKYDPQFIENLGYILLQENLSFQSSVLNPMQKNEDARKILYVIGAYFINQLRGTPTVLSEDYPGLHEELSNKLDLQRELNFSILDTLLRDVDGIDALKFITDHRIQMDADMLAGLLQPMSSESMGGYLEDYKRLGKALFKTDPEQFASFEEMKQTDIKSGMDYCLNVFRAITQTQIPAPVVVHTQEIKAESPQTTLRKLREEYQKPQSMEEKGKKEFQLAQLYTLVAGQKTSPSEKITYYKTAAALLVKAKKNKYNLQEIQQLAEQIKSVSRDVETTRQVTQSGLASFNQPSENRSTPAANDNTHTDTVKPQRKKSG